MNMADIGTGFQIAATLSNAFGAYRKSAGEQQGFQFQSQVSRTNAGLAELQASDALLRGQLNEQTIRLRTAQVGGTQRASLAARGIDLGEGSALNILTDTNFMGERDALLARDNANKEAWGFRTQAANYRSNADLMDWRAGQESPESAAFGTLLTGAGRVASSWYALRDARTNGATASGG